MPGLRQQALTVRAVYYIAGTKLCITLLRFMDCCCPILLMDAMSDASFPQANMATASSQLEELHISLSRTVAIRFADQQPLLAELREALQRTRRHESVSGPSEPALKHAVADESLTCS